MADISITGAGAHSQADLDDHIPATKAGVKGYLTPEQISTFVARNVRLKGFAQAYQGQDGEPGEAGPPGRKGAIGPQGNAGPTGPRGRQGPEGPAGDDGSDGYPGRRGTIGPTGPTGPRGLRGLPGPALEGPEGEPGERIPGRRGATGPTGVTGPSGPRGSKGPPGDTGDDGDYFVVPGRRGAAGSAGGAGTPGLRGYIGPSGLDGEDGDWGPPGRRGATGPQGPAGGGGGSAVTVEVDLGSPKFAGKFTITDAGISGTSKVLCWQAPGPYTGKGTRADEAEMQPVQVIAVEPGAGSAVVKWQTPPISGIKQEGQVGRRNTVGATFDRVINQLLPETFQLNRAGRVNKNVKFSYLVFT